MVVYVSALKKLQHIVACFQRNSKQSYQPLIFVFLITYFFPLHFTRERIYLRSITYPDPVQLDYI